MVAWNEYETRTLVPTLPQFFSDVIALSGL